MLCGKINAAGDGEKEIEKYELNDETTLLLILRYDFCL